MQSSLDARVHFQALSESFEKLLERDSDFDLEVKCGQKTLKTHRNVLCTRSDVFRRMLHEDNTAIVEIQDVDTHIFQKFLVYIYSGRLPELTVDTAKGLYEVGKKYAVAALQNACSEFLVNNLTAERACNMLLLADVHGDEKFKDDVIEYFLAEKVPLTYKCWKSFNGEYPVLANVVLNRFIRKYCSK